ncbi:hypothetical protein FRB91_006976 [Serendipita sp. 411]|nr:hypothetical protein FRB91_006976 [Serendipita sp. 411]
MTLHSFKRKKQASKAKQSKQSQPVVRTISIYPSTRTRRRRTRRRTIELYRLPNERQSLPNPVCVNAAGKVPNLSRRERVKPLYCMYPPYPYVPNTASSSFFAGSPVYNFRGTSARSGRKDGMTGRVESGVA